MEVESKIIKPGTVTITPDGFVKVEGFEIQFTKETTLTGCQEYFHAGATWAIQKIAEALAPGNQHKGGID
jgi:hypothetical protein